MEIRTSIGMIESLALSYIPSQPPCRVLALAEKTRERLTPERNFTTGAYARDAKGREVETLDRLQGAACWCLTGAILVTSRELRSSYDVVAYLLRRLEAAIRRTPARASSLPVFNDAFEHEAVLDLLDGVIDELRKETS